MKASKSATTLLQCALFFATPMLVAQQTASTTPQEIQQLLPLPAKTDDPSMVLDPGHNEIPLRLEQPISSESSHKGDRVRLTLARSFIVDGKTVLAAGTPFYATVSRVRPKNQDHNGELELSDARLDLGNESPIRFDRHDPAYRLGPGGVAMTTLTVILELPLIAVALPVLLVYLVTEEIGEHRDSASGQIPRPETKAAAFEAGHTFTYYAGKKTIKQLQSLPATR